MAVTFEQRLGIDILLNVVSTDDTEIGANNDFKQAIGTSNLNQAIINRIRTIRGELTLHPDYGSRLPNLIGTIPNEFTLGLARQHVREALLQEPRIDTIDSISVTYTDSSMKVLSIDIIVTPINSEEPLNIVFPFGLTGEENQFGTINTDTSTILSG